jgi:hypothetical protein
MSHRTALRFALIMPVAGLLLASGAAQASRDPQSGDLPPKRDHEAFGLCATANILPVARFHSQYTDPIGNHYHGWIPPAGPPYFVECLSGDSLVRSQP